MVPLSTKITDLVTDEKNFWKKDLIAVLEMFEEGHGDSHCSKQCSKAADSMSFENISGLLFYIILLFFFFQKQLLRCFDTLGVDMVVRYHCVKYVYPERAT